LAASAQFHWQSQHINIQIPVYSIGYSSPVIIGSQLPSQFTDSATYFQDSLSVKMTFKYAKYIDDASSVPYLATIRAMVRFDLDTVSLLINNLTISESTAESFYDGRFDSHSYYLSSSFSFLPLHYQALHDGNTIIYYASSSQCIPFLQHTVYDEKWSYTRVDNQSPNVYSSEIKLDSVAISDSSAFLYDLRFSLLMQFNSVPSKYEHVIPFTGMFSIDDQSVKFTFDQTLNTELLTIYDILGRKFVDLEIPAAVNDYRIKSLPPGTYFARLGNLTTTFIVP
jgi:hypothetical protein